MKSWCVVALMAAGLGFYAQAKDNLEAQAINGLSQQCGRDVLCYFSREQVSQALGGNAVELVRSGLFELDQSDIYKDEEGGLSQQAADTLNIDVGATEFSARKRSRPRHASTDVSSHTSAPIWGSFVANFNKCAPGCLPANLITFGERNNLSPTAGRGNFSCHPEGRAIDVGAIVCKGKAHHAIDNGKFATFVACMKRKMKTLWHQGRKKGNTRGHYDHAHFSNGCVAADGNNWI